MAELSNIIEQYQKHVSFKFIMDYLEIRDICLEGRQVTTNNLNQVIGRIKAELELKLAQYQAAA